jgi:hypothetical protein
MGTSSGQSVFRDASVKPAVQTWLGNCQKLKACTTR